MTTTLVLLAILGALGAWDTLYYHEWKLHLPARPQARVELTLHASRDFAYAILFASIGWLTWNGALAWPLMGLLLFEIVVTLWDFIEEDRTRVLPPGERAGHAIMGIVYGLFLAHLWPSIHHWTGLSTGFSSARYGPLSWLLTAMGIGVLLSGMRDLISARTFTPGPDLIDSRQ